MIVQLWTATEYLELETNTTISQGIMNDGLGLFVSKLSGTIKSGVTVDVTKSYRAVFDGSFLGIFVNTIAVEENGVTTYEFKNVFEEFNSIKISDLIGGLIIEGGANVDAPTSSANVIAIMPQNANEIKGIPAKMERLYTPADVVNYYERQVNNQWTNEGVIDDNHPQFAVAQRIDTGVMGFRPSWLLSTILGILQQKTNITIANDVLASNIDDVYFGLEYEDINTYKGGGATDATYSGLNVPDDGSQWVEIRVTPNSSSGYYEGATYNVTGIYLSLAGTLTIQMRDKNTGEIVASDTQNYLAGIVNVSGVFSNVVIPAFAAYEIRVQNNYLLKLQIGYATVTGMLIAAAPAENRYMIPYASLTGDLPLDEAFRTMRLIYGINLVMDNDNIRCIQTTPHTYAVPDYIPYKIEKKAGNIIIGKNRVESDIKPDKELLKDCYVYSTLRAPLTTGTIISVGEWENVYGASLPFPLLGQGYDFLYSRNYQRTDLNLTNPANVITFESSEWLDIGDKIYISNDILDGVEGTIVAIEENDGRRKITAYG